MNNLEKTTKEYSKNFNELYAEEPEILLASLELQQGETFKTIDYSFKTDVAILGIFITALNASDPQYASGWTVKSSKEPDEILNDFIETRKILSKGFVMGQSDVNLYIPYPKPILIYKDKPISINLSSNEYNKYTALKVLIYFTRVFR
jgi:hypothetical protein